MVRIGHASGTENKNSGWDGKAKAGDQTGSEVCVRKWYSKPWHTILRAKDPIIAQAMAKFCEDGCANNHIGYDQSQRNTAYKEAQKVNYNLSMIATNCETDCSAFMTLCAICAGIKELEYDPIKGNAPRTANMVDKFNKTGKFTVITGSGIVNSIDYVRRGDILVGNGHTAMILDDGNKNYKQHKTIKLGSVGDDVEYLHSKLKPLGYGVNTYSRVFDKNTEQCVKHFQAIKSLEIDGIVGPLTWKALE